MSKTVIISTRVDSELKANVEQILFQLGMTTEEAIRMFLKQLELDRGLPFTPCLPPQRPNDSKRFEVQTFELGSDVTLDRDELYSERDF